MSVYKKLNEARITLQNTPLHKSGNNKFAGYKYFELGDFLPTINHIFDNVGLCGLVSFSAELATLTITDTEDGSQVSITSPMGSANLKGCHEVQNIGAVETYQRRYLWSAALEIIENDVLDSTTNPVEAPKKAEPAKSAPAAPAPSVPAQKAGEWIINVATAPEGDMFEWFELVNGAAETMLSFAEKENDILQIFQKNKILFNKVKELDESVFKVMMEKFTEAKTKLQGK
jgi:hypothetical protein